MSEGTGKDLGFYLGGGAPLRNDLSHVFFILPQTPTFSKFKKSQVISRGGAYPPVPPDPPLQAIL